MAGDDHGGCAARVRHNYRLIFRVWQSAAAAAAAPVGGEGRQGRDRAVAGPWPPALPIDRNARLVVGMVLRLK